MAGGPVAELVEHTVAVRLLHLGVDVKARVAQLRDFLGKQLHSCAWRGPGGGGGIDDAVSTSTAHDQHPQRIAKMNDVWSTTA